MKQIKILIILLFTGLISSAQEGGKVVQTIKGKVIDKATNEAVSYTNIGLENTFYGTASDENGNFELKIPAEMVTKNIYFSAVGFKNKKFPVKSLFNKEFNVVKMESQSYGINDIDVAAQSKVLLRILRMASENIPYNYVGGPFNLHCTYKNQKSGGTSGTSTVEADVLIYDKNGYSSPSIKNAYQSLKYQVKKETREEDYRFSTGALHIDELLNLDMVRSASSILNPGLLVDFRLKLDSEPVIEGKDCWVIVFELQEFTHVAAGNYYANSFSGKITIEKEDYSVLQIETEIKSPKNSSQGQTLATAATSKNLLTDVSCTGVINYKDFKPANITLEKRYISEGQRIKENAQLNFGKIQMTNLTELGSRDYFAGQ